jgi:D-arabinose 1-dehydrogenase-like Zn-dependent alcohol dehydrogenase
MAPRSYARETVPPSVVSRNAGGGGCGWQRSVELGETCGLCHTDIHAARGKWPVKPSPPSVRAFEQALGSLARGGTLVCVGLPADNAMSLPIFETVLGGLTITGSIVGTHQDVVDVFDLHRRGLTRVERQEARLDDVNEAIEAVLDGSAGAARTVFRMESVDEAAAKFAALATV